MSQGVLINGTGRLAIFQSSGPRHQKSFILFFPNNNNNNNDNNNNKAALDFNINVSFTFSFLSSAVEIDGCC